MKASYLVRALVAVAVLGALLLVLLHVDRARILRDGVAPVFYQAGQLTDAAQVAGFSPEGFEVPGGASGPALLGQLKGSLVHWPRSAVKPAFGHVAPDPKAQVDEVLTRDKCLRVRDIKLVWPASAGAPPRVTAIAQADLTKPLCEPSASGAACAGVTVWLEGRRADC
jgi:hypothetical protein